MRVLATVLFLVCSLSCAAAQSKPTSAQTQIAAAKSAILGNWQKPAGSEQALNIRIKLKKDGTLLGKPVVLTKSTRPLFAETRQSAIQSIYQSQPFTMLSAKNYGSWKELVIVFDPKDPALKAATLVQTAPVVAAPPAPAPPPEVPVVTVAAAPSSAVSTATAPVDFNYRSLLWIIAAMLVVPFLGYVVRRYWRNEKVSARPEGMHISIVCKKNYQFFQQRFTVTSTVQFSPAYRTIIRHYRMLSNAVLQHSAQEIGRADNEDAYVRVRDFMSPHRASFRTSGDARLWATDVEQALERFKSFLESNRFIDRAPALAPHMSELDATSEPIGSSAPTSSPVS